MSTVTLTIPAEQLHPGDIVADRWNARLDPKLTVADVRPVEPEGVEITFAGDPVPACWHYLAGPVTVERPKALLASHYQHQAALAAGTRLAVALSDLMLAWQLGAPHDEMGAEIAAGEAALQEWKRYDGQKASA